MQSEDAKEGPLMAQVRPLRLDFERICVVAHVEEEVEANGVKEKVERNKFILKSCSGSFEPGTFTAILGPSGCGKTTMLNLIAGRQLSDNLRMYGQLRVNGRGVASLEEFKEEIGYVMQDDCMLPTFTPAESFKFVVDLRLSHLEEAERVRIVEGTIKALGLEKCRDTYVGDALLRGVSGGERKRTSIGLELLINPAMLFLDEPTTGLDSTTSLNLVRLLKQLALNGRTVVSTIHQPSSEIFEEFNRIMLMVNGHVIYQGDAAASIEHFRRIGLAVPAHYNPADHYMKLMNKEGIMLQYIEAGQPFTEEQVKAEFEARVQHLVQCYSRTQGGQAGSPEASPAKPLAESPTGASSAGWCLQFAKVFGRNVVNQVRQPLDVSLKVLQMVFFGVVTIVLFYQQPFTDNQALQNNQGVAFNYVSNITMSFIFSNVTLFNFERATFIRERLSNTYCVSAYYCGRTLATLPVEFLAVLVYMAISFFTVNLGNSAATFFLLCLAMVLNCFMSAGLGLLLSTIFPDATLVMALVPVLIIPFMLCGGYFIQVSSMFPFYYIFAYTSPFRYAYEAFVGVVYRDGFAFPSAYKYPLTDGTYSFQIPTWAQFLLLFLLGLAIRLLALLMLHKISNPKIIPLHPAD